ncbi:hypothetical protein [Terriglobus sp.]|uniref:hypothetical protein n=1 Tax=Terriglobus sp. TaxID=1889013 RepID=UPI003AFF98E1
MRQTTHMQRLALAITAAGCMAVPVQGALAQAAPQQLQLASNTPIASASYSSSTAVDAPAPLEATPPQQQGYGSAGYATPVESHSYWHTHGFDLAGLATGRLQQNIDEQGPTTVGQSFDAGFLASVREHPVSWAGIEFDYGYQKYTEHYRFSQTQPFVGYQPIQQHEATAGYVFHIKTPWIQPFVVLGGGGVYFKSSRVQPPNGSGLNNTIGDQWRGAYMANIGFDITSKRAKNFGLRIEEHSLFYKAPDFYQANLRSNAYVHQAMPSAGFFYRF